jgi:hypothetical protein
MAYRNRACKVDTATIFIQQTQPQVRVGGSGRREG